VYARDRAKARSFASEPVVSEWRKSSQVIRDKHVLSSSPCFPSSLPPPLPPFPTAVDEEDGVKFGWEEGKELLGVAGAARVVVPSERKGKEE
jgi:hypothetical protein